MEEKKARLQELENYDELREQAEKELEQAEAVLKEHSEALSAARKQFAGELVEKIADGLRELNFLDVQFEMEFRRLDHFTAERAFWRSETAHQHRRGPSHGSAPGDRG